MTDFTNWEHVVDKINVLVREFVLKLHTTWEEIGLKEDVRAGRYEQVYGHVRDLMNDMLTESEHNKTAILQNVQKLMEEATVLSKELRTEAITHVGYQDIPLAEVEIKLKQIVQELRCIRERRLNYLKELLTKEYEICKALGVQPMGIATDLPSEDELKSFKLYLEKQEAEKKRLESTFKDMRRSIINMMDELHITPSLDFERLVCNNYVNFVFTNNNMTSLRELRDQLKDQVEEAKQRAKDRREELMALWKYLEEPNHSCEAFLETYSGYNVTTLNALKEEINRCKDKRSENIAKYVCKVRSELENLWDMCQFSDAQRRAFVPMASQTFTEDLLTLHELEVERLRKYYEANRPIFELLNERNNLWEKMKELEQRANDPDRFHNRGGQLLTEEKERKLIQKKLPKIEAEMTTLLQAYEIKNGEIFTVNGVPLFEMLKQSWADFGEAKQTMKSARKQARDRSEYKKTPMSMSKRTPAATSISGRTPIGSNKRKQPCEPTPTNSVVKRRNLTSSEKNRPTVSGSKLKKGSNRVSRRIFTPVGHKSNTSNDRQRSFRTDSQSSANSTSSYGEFQEHLAQREELRSSVLPERLLRNRNNKSHMRTPVKTPVKPLRKNILAPTTPKQSTTPKLTLTPRGTPRSPKLAMQCLATAPSNLPFIF